MNLLNVAIIVLALNVPFGYWRANTRRFSRQWFLSVHIPVPIVIAFRIFAGFGWRLITFPVLIGAFFLGQLLGGKLHSWSIRYTKAPGSSCIFRDMMKITDIFRPKK
ncbi:hypothetical protein BMS3Bbin15_00493 [archaeon BMS3Bbin15]|nr:hypothetical protein BMS3Bbin15_00493 [archaeon BMS3Bbin15]